MLTITREEFEALEFEYEIHELTRNSAKTLCLEEEGRGKLIHASRVTGAAVGRSGELEIRFDWIADDTAGVKNIFVDPSAFRSINFEIVDVKGCLGLLLLDKKLRCGAWKNLIRL